MVDIPITLNMVVIVFTGAFCLGFMLGYIQAKRKQGDYTVPRKD